MGPHSRSRHDPLLRSAVLRAFPVAMTGAILVAGFSSVAFCQRPVIKQAAEPSPQRRKTEIKSHLTYSTFDSAGVNSIRCEGIVDWATLFRGQTNASFREQVLPVLEGTRFLISLERDGTVRLSTRSTVAPVSQQAADRARESIESFGGVLATVLEGWARFAVTADLPPATDNYKLDRSGDHYLIAFKKGPADVAITMDRYFAMREDTTSAENIGIESSAALSLIKSAPTTNGFLVTGWSIAFPRGKGNGLSVDARYTQVEGVEVPVEMTLRSSLPNFGEITLPLLLTNYQFER